MDLITTAVECLEIKSAKKTLQEKLIYLTSPLPTVSVEQAEQAEIEMIEKSHRLLSLQASISTLNTLSSQQSGLISHNHRECLSCLKTHWEDEKKSMSLSRSRLLSEDPRGFRCRITDLNHLIQLAKKVLSCERIEEIDPKDRITEQLCHGAEKAFTVISEQISKLQNKDIPEQRLLIEILKAQEHYFNLLLQYGMPTPSTDALCTTQAHRRPILSLELPIQSEPKYVALEPQTTLNLIQAYQTYDPIPFYESIFINSLKGHIDLHSTYTPSAESMGYVEKKIVDDKSKIYVRADMHGDLKTLMLELKNLQTLGHLDGSFRCEGNFHMVFLGDYMDRGLYGMQILQLLVALKIANPDKVTLIKGNHEDVDQHTQSLYFSNKFSNKKDQNLFKFLVNNNQDEKNSKLLTNFYKTLSFNSFIGQKGKCDRVEYAMFTHGMFELTLDPTELLGDTEKPHQTLEVPYPVMDKNFGLYSQLSERVQALIPREGKNYHLLIAAENDPTKKNQLKKEYAAKRINDLVLFDRRNNTKRTAFNWGDVSQKGTKSHTHFLDGRRTWTLSPEDINLWMILNSINNFVIRYLFRGHQHEMQHHCCDDGKQIATTMSVAMLGAYKDSDSLVQNGISYVLETGSTLERWTKIPLVIDTESGRITTEKQMAVDSDDDLNYNRQGLI